jgi:hypothetical protein
LRIRWLGIYKLVERLFLTNLFEVPIGKCNLSSRPSRLGGLGDLQISSEPINAALGPIHQLLPPKGSPIAGRSHQNPEAFAAPPFGSRLCTQVMLFSIPEQLSFDKQRHNHRVTICTAAIE